MPGGASSPAAALATVVPCPCQSPGSVGSFLTGYLGQDRSSTTVYYESAGLSATQLTVAAVPEPGAWAIMLFGAGFVGMSLRSRRTRGALTLAPRIARP